MSEKGVPVNKFKNQNTITSVFFSTQCSYIGESAFEECISLECFNEGNNNLKNINIGSIAFKGCTKLSYIDISGSYTNKSDRKIIYNNAFENCTNLSNANINGYTIKPSIFKNCTNLSNLSLNDCIIDGDYAFASCKNLSYVDINDCIIDGDYAFAACANLISVSNNFSKINNYTFYNCINLRDIDLSICETIYKNAFCNCINLSEISLNKCKTIGSFAFVGCSNISQVNLPVCKTIHPYAFFGCSNLKKIYISNDKCELKNTNAFSSSYNYFYFKNIDKILSIYASATNWSYYKKNMLPIVKNKEIVYKGKNVSIQTDIQNIENTYYEDIDCGILKFNYIVKYMNQMFKNNTNLTYIDIPSECIQIVESAFEGCTNLTNITLSNTLKKIEDYAFRNCESLSSFVLPDSIDELEEGIFSGCKNIKKIESKFTTFDGNAIVYNNNLTCLLPSYNKKTILIDEIDKNLKRLGKYCFSCCENIETVYIPSNILSIGNYAFENCKNLKKVYFIGTPPILGLDVFKNVNRNFKIYVPKDLISIYKLLYENDGYSNIIYSY